MNGKLKVVPRPVFVFGLPRGGTTLIGYLLAQHPSIAGVMGERYGGLKETDIIGTMEYYFGDISIPVNLVRLVETMAASDYFLKAGVPKGVFYEKKPKKMSEFFRLLMEQYSTKNDCTHWVEKSPTHLLCYERVLEEFPDAFVVIIQRDTLSCVNSYLKLQNPTTNLSRYMMVVKAAVRYAIYESKLQNLIKNADDTRSIIIPFDGLIREIPETCSKICDALGLVYCDEMSIVTYDKNTSFYVKENDGSSVGRTPKNSELIVKVLLYIYRFVPSFVKSRLAKQLLRWSPTPMAHHWGLLLEKHGFNEEQVAPGGWGGVPENRPIVK